MTSMTCGSGQSVLPTSVGFAAVSVVGGDVWELEKLLGRSGRVAGDLEKAWSELIALSPALTLISNKWVTHCFFSPFCSVALSVLRAFSGGFVES